MAYRVAHEMWLATESSRLREFVLMPKFWGMAWTAKRLQRELHDIGLDYKIEEIEEINDQLHKQLVVEDIVDETDPVPVPVG